MLLAAAPTVPRDQALWARETARLLAGAADLSPAVRASVRAVLLSLGRDAGTDAGTRADVAALLEAIDATR